MEFLRVISSGFLSHGIPVPQLVREDLIEIALRLQRMTCAFDKGEPPKGILHPIVVHREFLSANLRRTFPSEDHELVAIPWFRHLMISLRRFDSAIQIAKKSSNIELSSKIGDIEQQVIDLVIKTIEWAQVGFEISKCPFSGRILENYHSLYDQFGILPRHALSKFCAAELQISNKFDLPKISRNPKDGELLIELGLQLVESKRSKTLAARSSTMLGSVIAAANELSMTYSTALVLIDWGIRRLEKARLQIHEDVYTERKVIEEYRVSCIETTRDAGVNFNKALLAMYVYHLSRGVSRKNAFRLAVQDEIVRDLLVPDVLAASWRAMVIETANLPDAEFSIGLLLRETNTRFLCCFTDTPVADFALRLQDECVGDRDLD